MLLYKYLVTLSSVFLSVIPFLCITALNKIVLYIPSKNKLMFSGFILYNSIACGKVKFFQNYEKTLGF